MFGSNTNKNSDDFWFEIGDVVNLKSGSPDLTITGFNNEKTEVNVAWFLESEEYKTGSFPVQTLE